MKFYRITFPRGTSEWLLISFVNNLLLSLLNTFVLFMIRIFETKNCLSIWGIWYVCKYLVASHVFQDFKKINERKVMCVCVCVRVCVCVYVYNMKKYKQYIYNIYIYIFSIYLGIYIYIHYIYLYISIYIYIYLSEGTFWIIIFSGVNCL